MRSGRKNIFLRFPAPRCDERGDWIFDPERYPESPAFTGDAGYPVDE